jgi:hypothetical protein
MTKEVQMEEELDLSAIGFPVLSDPLEEDFPLQLCACPYCRQSHWIIPRSDYYFTCGCGGVSIYNGLTLRIVTAAEYEAIRDIKRTKPEKTLGLA